MAENLLADPVILRFDRSDGSEVLSADLIDLAIGFDQSNDGRKNVYECIGPFQAFLAKRFNVNVSASQAYAIYMTVRDEYDRFKKKFDRGSMSPTPSEFQPTVSAPD